MTWKCSQHIKKKKKVMKVAEGIPPRPNLPWDLARLHTVTGWRRRHAAGSTRNNATVPTGSWCSCKTRAPQTLSPPPRFTPAPRNWDPRGGSQRSGVGGGEFFCISSGLGTL